MLDQRAHCGHQREAGEQRNLCTKLGLLWCHQHDADNANECAKDDATHSTLGHGARVGDHEVGKDEDLWRGNERQPHVRAAHGGKSPTRREALTRSSVDCGAGRQHQPERDHRRQQTKPVGDERTTNENHKIGDDHGWV